MAALQTDNPLAIRLQNQLGVMYQWATINEAMLEQFDTNKAFYHFFVRSESLAAMYASLIALHAN